MTKDQALRIQHELVKGSGCLPSAEPFFMYGVWAFPFLHKGIELPVYLIDRDITGEPDHLKAKKDAAYQLGMGLGDS